MISSNATFEQHTVVSVYLKTTYFCTDHACTEIDIYVPKWTVPIFCMYRNWLYWYWHSMYWNWMYRKNMYLKCMYRNCPVPKATYPVTISAQYTTVVLYALKRSAKPCLGQKS